MMKFGAKPTILPRNRSKDITYYAYFQGSISRGLWRFVFYRFTPASGWMLALTLLFMSYSSNTLDIQAYTPVAYFLCVWLVTLIAALLSRPRVSIDARHADRVQVGETLPIELTVTQKRRWRHVLNVVAHRLPPSLDPSPGDGVKVPALAFGESAQVTTGLVCRERGVYLWHGFRVETDFPFGLFRAYTVIPQTRSVMVTPRYFPLTGLAVPAGRRYQPGGVAMASHIGDSFEFVGNREYRQGDNLRDMDWRATARLNRPIVREYREEYFLRVGVVLDTYLPSSSAQQDRDNFERAVSVAAAVSDYMARSDYIVDLFAAGPNLYHLTAGRSLAYIDRILEILACVEGNPEEPFETLEPELVESLAQITSVVCVFLDWDDRRRQFVDQLLSLGAGLKVVVVRDRACTLDTRDNSLPGGITVVDAQGFAAGVKQL